MRTLLFLVIVFLVPVEKTEPETSFSEKEELRIQIEVSDLETKASLPFVGITIFEKELVVVEGTTDVFGKLVCTLPKGAYTLSANCSGFEPLIQVPLPYQEKPFVIQLKRDETPTTMGADVDLEEVVVAGYGVESAIEKADVTKLAGKKKPRTKKPKKTASVTPSPPSSTATPPPPPPPPPVIEEVPAEFAEEDYEIAYDPETYEERIVLKDGVVEDAPEGKGDFGPEKKKVKSGQITAGEWCDLDDWAFWMDATENPEKEKSEAHWQLFPRNRYTVRVTNRDYQPLVDAPVRLLDPAGEILWEAKTDYEGRAEMFARFFDQRAVPQLKIEVDAKNEVIEHTLVRPFEEGVNHIQVPINCFPSKNVDIYFAVDATGSMGDEIEFLKAELEDVINRVKKNNKKLNLRLGALFYRDQSDNFLVESSILQADIKPTLSFIQSHYAGGGGDYPEAVEVALEHAIDKQEWAEEARTRVLFLVLDAPPHHNPEVLLALKKYTYMAAQKGIKIIPVTGSGIEKETEYLMKSLAIASNGTYVFLTDDSGIGGGHIQASAKDYNVELLNDLMVRLIEKYSREMCDDESRWRGAQSLAANPLDGALKVYPNPSDDHCFIELSLPADLISVVDASGKIMQELPNWQGGKFRLNTADWPSGTYMIKVTQEDQIASRPFVKMY